MTDVEPNKIKEILQTYRETIVKIEEALRIAGMPEHMIPLYTIYFPEFTRMLPEDAIMVYSKVREALILYLHQLGFTSREISMRTGGNSHKVILEVLKRLNIQQAELTKDLASTEEVIKEADKNNAK